MEIKPGRNTTMRVKKLNTYSEMSQHAAKLVIQFCQQKPDALLCVPTGNSPQGLYAEMIKSKEVFQSTRFIKLDEWGGIEHNSAGTCELQLNEQLYNPLGTRSENQISFRSDSNTPEKECERIQRELNTKGPIDICILGLGRNGHIGFNEPAAELQPHCHIAKLTSESMGHTMIQNLEIKPSYGLTLGISDILAAKHIILLVTGSNKTKVLDALLSGEVSPHYPVTMLLNHMSVDCLIDLGTVK